MKNKAYRYYIGIFTVLVSLIAISIIFYKSTDVENDSGEEIIVQDSEMKTKAGRSYNTYTATVEFDEGLDKFFGNEIITYVHEFKQSTDTIFLKLGLNDYHEPFYRYSYHTTEGLDQYSNSPIAIKSVKVAGQQISYFQQDTNLVVHLEEKLNENETISLLIEFEGKVPLANDYVGRYKKNIWLKDFLPRIRVYNDEEGWMSVDNYGEQHYSYSETSKYKVTIIVDEMFDVMTGTPFTNCLDENGKKNYIFEANMVRDFGIYIGLPKNKKEFALQQNKKLIIYSDNDTDLDNIASKVDALFAYYNDIFGTYPYDTFVIVDSNSKYAISYPKMLITNLNDKEAFMNNIGKNIGNQWIPYIITHNPQKDDALNSGLVEYMANREKSSVQSMKKQLEEYQDHHEDKVYKDVSWQQIKSLLEKEEQLGERVFRERLRQYYKTYAFTIATKQNFDEVMRKDYQNDKNKISNNNKNE